jgi:membrane protein implicated in regulation of membrane protease activity
MKWLGILLVFILVLQVVLFIYGRKYRNKIRNSVVERYNLKSRGDAWRALGDPTIPEEDKNEIKKLYDAED